MQELLLREFYNNTIGDWIISMGMILGAIIVGKLLYWFLSTVIKRLTKRTKTKLDDIIVDMMEEPLVVVVVFVGFWYGMERLNFGEGFSAWLGNMMNAGIILTITWLLVRLFDALVQEYVVPLTEKSKSDLDDQILPIARKGVKGITWIVGIVVALNNAGFDIGALIAGLGIGGLALAMAAKDSVSNIFGGFTIFTDKPFSLGDRIKVGGFDGTVEEIGIRSSRIRTLEGRMVTIPNSKIADSMVENVTSEPSRKIIVKPGIVYEVKTAQIQQAIDILKKIAKAHDALEESSTVGFMSFGDSALELLLIYYIKPGFDIVQTQTEINLEIFEQFSKTGLEFAYPTQTLYTKK